jgi:hypothetical protein
MDVSKVTLYLAGGVLTPHKAIQNVMNERQSFELRL